ncbi:hypothetical protein [Neobacillus muris]|uniref:hypothetical protein n=1 Tax=Neobacillus muris TaxID=2941334 RepID=UPI002041041F|nr:hypothetical protein [Neobacillus muris]
MSVIKLNESVINSANGKLSNTISKLSSAENELSQLASQLDYRVRSRSSADTRLRSLCNDLEELKDQLKKIERFVSSKSGQYFDVEDYLEKYGFRQISMLRYYDFALAKDPFFMMALAGSGLGFLSGTFRSETLLRYKGLRFTTVERNGKIYLKVLGGEIGQGNSWQYNRYRDSLVNLLGGDSSTFRRRFAERLVNGGGIPLYVDGRGTINDNMRRFERLSTVNQFIEDYDKSAWTRMKNGFNPSLVDGMKVWQDFGGWKEATNLSRTGKFFGAAGTVLTVGNNFVENFRSNGHWDFSLENTKTFTVNTGVDVATGAGAMAAGAAIGSFIAPPIGTVVGVAAGATFNFLINTKVGGPPPKSVVDHTKDFVNDLIDNPVDAIGDRAAAVGEKIGDVAKGAGKLVNNIGKGLGNLFGG